MDNIMEQHKCIKNATVTINLIKSAFEGNNLSRCITFDWFKLLKEVWNSIGDDQRPGQPLTS